MNNGHHNQIIDTEEDPFGRGMGAASDPFPLAPPAEVGALLLDDPVQRESHPSSGQIVEVIVGWGTSVLEVKRVRADHTLRLAVDDHDPTGTFKKFPLTETIVVPEELLGSRSEVVLRPASGAPRLVLSPSSIGTYRETSRAGAVSRTLTSVLDRAMPSSQPDRVELPLVVGAIVTLEVAGLWLRFDATRLPRQHFRDWTPDLGVLAYFAGSFLAFGSLLTSLAYFTPFQGLEDEGTLDRERLISLQQYLSAAAVREQESQSQDPKPTPKSAGGEASAAAPGEPGIAGKPNAAAAPKKLAVRGSPDNRQVRLSPQETLALARDWGMIGLLKGGRERDTPFSAFARDPALGADDLDARGNLWALTIGEAAGQNGLFLSGNGPGGLRGPGTGVGIDGPFSGLGTLGHCTAGELCSFGTSVGKTGGDRRPGVPVLRTAETSVSGSIPPAVVQRIVRQNFGRFRFCYEQGLARNPSLEGRVAVRFVIDRSGAVSTTSALGGGMPDSKVSSCVAQAFYGLSFPPPDRGIVTVTYPLLFSPE